MFWKLLCLIGIHKWQYVTWRGGGIIHHVRECDRCGAEKGA